MPDVRDARPLVISLCGTFLKPEMRSIHRQVTALDRTRTVVYTQSRENAEMFPFDPVVTMTKLARPRLRGNFILRFWFKYVVKKWPPPFPINKEVRPYYPYDLVTLLRRDKPDLVHVYYGHKAVHYLDMLRAWGGPWIVSFHGVDVSKFIDEEGYSDRLQSVFAEARLVLGRSRSLLAKLESLGCPKEKLRLNRAPLPIEALDAIVRTPPPGGEWRFVQACRLIPKKGIFTALQALAIVRRTHPRFRYLLCGDGPMREEIARAAAGLGLEDRVEFAGWLPQEDLLAEYRRSHFFLHPSEKTADEDQEGIPNSMLEAMATGLPVVATLHGGIPEAVEEGRSGLLAPERAPEELARAILRVMEEPGLLGRMSEQAAASVRKTFGGSAQIKALEDAYLEAIPKPGRP